MAVRTWMDALTLAEDARRRRCTQGRSGSVARCGFAVLLAMLLSACGAAAKTTVAPTPELGGSKASVRAGAGEGGEQLPKAEVADEKGHW